MLRALFRPFALHAAYTPIETIVFFSIIGTLAYFHILNAIKLSYKATHLHRPAYLVHRLGEWLPIAPRKHVHVEVVPFEHVPSYFSSVCYRPKGTSECFSFQNLLAFKPNTYLESTTAAATDWLAPTLKSLFTRFASLARNADSLDILLILLGYILMHTTFYLLLSRSRALGSSFFLPLAIISSAVLSFLIALPIAMALKIPIDPVALTEALPFLVCTVGFDKPLRLARAVFLHPHLTIPPLLLPNASPDPASGYPIIHAPPSLISSALSRAHLSASSSPLKPAPKIITESLSYVYTPIIRDYILEIAVLTVGAYSRVGGLREVCALAALTLAIDCLLMCTYLAAILGVMVEVRRISVLKGRRATKSKAPDASVSLSRSVSSSSLASSLLSSPGDHADKPGYFTRLLSFVLGEKGASLYNLGKVVVKHGRVKVVPTSPSSMANGKSKTKGKEKENPVARLKLLLITSFLILHILNFITPLTPSKHTYSSAYYAIDPTSSTSPVNRKVDISSPAVRAMLTALLEAEGVGLTEEAREMKELYVKVYPPAQHRLFSSLSSVPGAQVSSSSSKSKSKFSLFKLLNRLVSSFSHSLPWSHTLPPLTDPTLSKTLLVMLTLSVVLNGYLLRGIASGFVGNAWLGGAAEHEDDGVTKCRFEEDGQKQDGIKEEEKEGQVEKMGRREVRPQLKVQTSLRLEDVDRKLELERAAQEQREKEGSLVPSVPTRSLGECIDIFENGPRPLSLSMELLTDEEVILLAQNGKIAAYALEKVLGTSSLVSLERAVRIRRALISRASRTMTLETSAVPFSNYDYSRVLNACCENVVGYIPIPLGIAGPLLIDSVTFPIPMATAEGTLVASTSRGCKALNLGGGVRTVITRDGMTRGPAVEFPTVLVAAEALRWVESEEGLGVLKGAFEGTSRFARLVGVKGALAGRVLYVRFKSTTGDAMGMNMVSKGTEKALEAMSLIFSSMSVLTLSGNYCTDKKPAAINWIEGRGKSVVAEAVVPGEVVKKILKANVEDLVNLNTKKNLLGSVMAGSIGGFNAHAANVLTAVYLATGQDPAQNVESSQCLTFMEAIPSASSPLPDLLITLTMPCLELGTVGGGTSLLPQQSVLELLGIKGAHPTDPGANAKTLARVVVAGVMAGELSLLGALCSGELIKAHMRHNRSVVGTPRVDGPER